MSSKQTAIDWLLEQTIYISSTKWPDIIEQAKEMEKQQIEESFKNGRLPLLFGSFKAEDYYNETYGYQ